MLNLNYNMAIYLIVTLALLTLVVFISLGLLKITRNYLDKIRAQRKNQVRRHLNLLLFEMKSFNLKVTPHDRNTFSLIARDIQGHYHNKLKQLYIEKKFQLKDEKDLFSSQMSTRYSALIRIFHLDIKLNEKTYLELFKKNDLNFTSLLMKQFIHHFGKNSLTHLVRFIDEKSDLSKGMLHSLIKSYSKVDPQGVVFLIHRANDPKLLQALLYASRLNPTEGLKEAIFYNIYYNSSLELKAMALRALKKCPDGDVLSLMKILKSDNNWVIRLHIVKLLEVFNFDSIEDLLQEFLNDIDYNVRKESVTVCLTMLPRSQKILDNVLKDPSNLSHSILQNKLSRNSIKIGETA